MRTEEQRAADAALEAAMERVARAYGWVPDTAHVTDFVGVIEAVQYSDTDPDAFDEYHFLAFRNGVARKSVGMGLLAIGHDLLLQGERVDFEGDEPPGD